MLDLQKFEQLAETLNAQMDPKFRKASFYTADDFAAVRKQMTQWMEKAETVLGQPMPQDFKDYFIRNVRCSANENFSWRSKLNDLSGLFDKFKPNHPELNANNPEVVHKTAKKYAFYEQTWLEEYSQDQHGWDAFNLLSRLKELLFFTGSGQHILVDFYDAEQPYRFYFYDGSMFLAPLDLDLETFLTYYIHFDHYHHWYVAFMKPADFQQSGSSDLIDRLKADYGQFEAYAEPIAALEKRIATLQ
ncbi:hypothetical protein [Flavobacterium sp.]|uniref:hypothetical protein n=1 Tax=Flavobacterium sp. TaxID=239 RepID=UPI0039E4A563